MSKEINLLDRVRIASPCSVSWSRMKGDDRVRFCDQCRLNVYNLSAMTRAEAETLIQTTEGRLCGAFYQRRDGTILTADCSVGLRAARRHFAALAGGIAALFALVFNATGLFGSSERSCQIDLRNVKPFASIYEMFRPQQQVLLGSISPPPAGMVILGEVGDISSTTQPETDEGDQ